MNTELAKADMLPGAGLKSAVTLGVGGIGGGDGGGVCGAGIMSIEPFIVEIST